MASSDGFVVTLKSILLERKEAVLERWLQDILATYAHDTGRFFRREKDQFANPVGHSLHAGARHILESLIEGRDPGEICRHLNEIIKIRAIQDLSPSQAVSFVLHLKGAIRAELGDEIRARGLQAQLNETDAEIDQMVLFAFDIYSRCREQVYELKVNEVKRNVSAIMERFCGKDSEPDPARGDETMGDDGVVGRPELEPGRLTNETSRRGGGK